MTTTRDSQRQKVYNAEWTFQAMCERQYESPTVLIYGSTLTLPAERKFADIDSIDSYIRRVLKMSQIRATYERAAIPVRVRVRQGNEKAHYERWNNVIAIPPWKGNRAWAMREIVVLHELAHHLDEHGGHGVGFASTYTNLITECMGAEAGFILTALFRDNGVSF